jgi:phosphate transport system substrate-binding protein
VNITLRTGAVAVAAAATLLLAACTPSNEEPDPAPTGGATSESPAELSGTLNGAGSSAQESAMEAWRAGFQSMNPGLTINYDPVGSGGGRTQFLEGAVAWAGSDSALSEDEYTTALEACGPDGAINLPNYISPIAVIFNLDGVDSLNMDAATIASIFDGKITRWNDPAIAALNEGVSLPDLAITTVHRGDESGTTKNFTDYLAKASEGAWPYEASGDWANALGESGQGTSGLVQIVTDTQGAIGYADASKAGTLGTVAIKVGEEFVSHSPEGAALALASSTRVEGNGPNDLAYKIDRTTTASGAYPLMLLSYVIVCQHYEDEAVRANVTGFLKYVASAEGQAAAASAAGSAPLPAELSTEIEGILDEIAAG